MPQVMCQNCRTEVQIPIGHDGPSFRCQLCWNEIALPMSSRSIPVAMALPVAKVVASNLKAPVAPIANISAKPLPKMAPLEALIQRANRKLSQPSHPTTATEELPTVQPRSVEPAPPPREQIPIAALIPPRPVSLPPQPALEPQPSIAYGEVVQPRSHSSVPVAQPRASHASTVVLDGELFLEDRPSRKSSRVAPTRRRRDADDDEEEDEDLDERPRRRRTESAKSNTGLYVGIGIGSFLLVAMLTYLGLSAFRSSPRDRGAAQQGPANNPGLQFDLPNPNAGNPGNPGIFPGFPAPVVQFQWKEFNGNGVTAKMFERRLQNSTSLTVNDPNYFFVSARGQLVRTPNTGNELILTIQTADVPIGRTPDLKPVADLKLLTSQPHGKPDETTECQIDGRAGLEHIRKAGSSTTTTRCLQVGCRIFLFRAEISQFRPVDPTALATAQKEFFDSIKITFDENTPAPVDVSIRLRKNR